MCLIKDVIPAKAARQSSTECLWTYNNEHPNMAIGGITPAMKLADAYKTKPLLIPGGLPYHQKVGKNR